MFLVFPFFAVFSSSQQSAVLIGWRLHLNTVGRFTVSSCNTSR